jgi:hypothetical protein
MDPKRAAQGRFDARRDALGELSHRIHADKALRDGAPAMPSTCVDLARQGIASL